MREASGAAGLELMEAVAQQLEDEENDPTVSNLARGLAEMSHALGCSHEDLTPTQAKMAELRIGVESSGRIGFFSIPHEHRKPNIR